MRALLDVNVLLSIAIGTLQPIRDAWKAGRFSLCISEPLIRELSEVLNRPKFARYLEPDGAAAFVEEVVELSTWVVVREPYPDFTDPKDRFLLAMLRDGEVDLLVTGDKALLSLGDFEGKPIVSPATFVRGYLASP
jgi:uncharacterized protein